MSFHTLSQVSNPRLLLLLLGGAAILCAFFSPLKVIGGIAALLVVALTFRDPKITILLLVALIPLEPFLLKFVPDDLYVYARFFSEILVYIVALSVCVQWAQGRARLRGTAAVIAIALLIGDAILSAIINQVDSTVSLLGIRQIIRFMVLGVAVSMLPYDSRFVRNVVGVLFAVALFESGLGIVQAVIGAPADSFLIPSERKVLGDVQLTAGTHQFWESGQRIFATMGRYDQLGTFLTLVLLLCVGLLYEKQHATCNTKHAIKRTIGKGYLLPVACFMFGIPALILTYSRASWFGFLLGAFCIGWFVKRDRRVLIGALLAIAAFATYLFFSWGIVSRLTDTPRQTILQRLSESMSPERWRGEYYGLGRLYYIVHTPLDVVSRSPLFGLGPGSYGGGAAAALRQTGAYDRANIPFGIYGTEGYIDNNWFSVWGELGTIGLALYVFLMISLIRSALVAYRTSGDPLTQGIALSFCGMAAAVSLQAFLGTYLEVRTLSFYFWLFAGLLLSAQTKNAAG